MYEEDLARIHHEGFSDFVRGSAPGLLRMLHAGGVDRGTVVDLGCGGGLWLAELDRAGYAAVGVDRSPAFISIAKGVAPRAELQIADAFDYDLPSCDAITALGEVLGYLPDGSSRKPPFARLFRTAHRALRPGGCFIFDLFVRVGRAPLKSKGWSAGPTWAVLTNASENPQRTKLTREITTFFKQGAGYRRNHERHVLSVVDPALLAKALRDAGFTVRTARRYGDQELLPHRRAFIARRR